MEQKRYYQIESKWNKASKYSTYKTQTLLNAVFTRDTFTWGKYHFTIENVTQYNRNVNLPQVNVSRVNTA